MRELELAWNLREHLGLFESSEAFRIFHGPGEGNLESRLYAIDRFSHHYWITQWEESGSRLLDQKNLDKDLIHFLKEKGAESVVKVVRPQNGLSSEASLVFGDSPKNRFPVTENGAQFWIQFQNTRHPGLFLDHEPLRSWLRKQTQGLRILNAFAYTGSLSVAAALGQASEITTLDLSKPAIEWAKENFLLNGIDPKESRWIVGDVFEWLPRLKKEKKKFDCLILDPPSFSRARHGQFSTAKDLQNLHEIALALLAEKGYLITSINSAKISWQKFEADVFQAAKVQQKNLSILKRIDLPESFPTPLGKNETRYLKGWILRQS